jgi:hypothetical protein
VLSGTVWKGTKLRVGEAKPDFSERCACPHHLHPPPGPLTHSRISRENAPPEPEDSAHPAKRRKLARGVHGVEAAEMTLVTPENASQRAGWKVLPSGRLIRPARMRPAHPLPPPLDFLRKAEKEKKPAGGKAKKARVKPPSTRARRKTIDPVRWGSVHLKGAYLDSVGAEARHRAPSPAVFAASPGPVSDSDSDSDAGLANASESAGDDDSESEVDEELSDASMVGDALPLHPSPPPPAMPSGLHTSASAAASAPGTSEVVTTGNLREETSHTLAFLRSLFADADAQGTDWGGAESADEEGHAPRRPLRATEMDPRDDGIVEEVPAVVRVAAPVLKEDMVDAEDSSEEEEEDHDDAEEHTVAAHVQTSQAPPAAVTAPKTSLKDLFAPREEEGDLISSLHASHRADLRCQPASRFSAISTSISSWTTSSTSLAGRLGHRQHRPTWHMTFLRNRLRRRAQASPSTHPTSSSSHVARTTGRPRASGAQKTSPSSSRSVGGTGAAPGSSARRAKTRCARAGRYRSSNSRASGSGGTAKRSRVAVAGAALMESRRAMILSTSFTTSQKLTISVSHDACQTSPGFTTISCTSYGRAAD